jgi:hypothetical protein
MAGATVMLVETMTATETVMETATETAMATFMIMTPWLMPTTVH